MFIGQFVSTPLSIHMKVGGCNQPKAQRSEDLKHWRLAQLGILGPLTSCMEKEKGRMGESKRRERERGRMWDRRERVTEREKGREDERERDRRERRGKREAGRSCFTLEPCLGNHVTSFLPHSICSGSQGLTWIQGDGLSLTGSTFWEWSDKKNMWEQKY